MFDGFKDIISLYDYVEIQPLTNNMFMTRQDPAKSDTGNVALNEEDIRKISKYQSATPGDFGNLSSRLRFMNQEKVTETYITDELCKMQEEKEYGKRSIGFIN